MKKLLLKMSILLSAGMFCACSNDDEMNVNGGESALTPDDGAVLSPINLSHLDKEFLFFSAELPIGERSTSFFVDSDNDECYVINSLEELKSIYKGNTEIPEINLEKYTLIIGQKIVSDAFYPVLKQDLMFSNHKYHLTLFVPDFDLANNKTQHLYYWALYPKFSSDDISVGIVKEKDAVQTIKDVTGYVWKNRYYDFWTYNDDQHIQYDKRLIYNEDPSGVFVDVYYPINLPDDYKGDGVSWTSVKFSGDIIEMTDGAREALQIANVCGNFYIINLTEIEVTE